MSWIAMELYRHGMIKIGSFKLSSGIDSPFYIDLRRLYSYPELARRVVAELLARVPLGDVDVVAGVESAGMPLAAYISCLTLKPMAYVRKERKDHGTALAVEGDVRGMKVAVVDDVATTGASLTKAVHYLREAGGIPVKAVVIVDREQGAREALSKLGIELYALVKASEIFDFLYKAGLISTEDYSKITSYLAGFKAVQASV